MNLVRNAWGGRIHRPDCVWAQQVHCKPWVWARGQPALVIRAKAHLLGYKVCKTCDPLEEGPDGT